jgi:hypothetical protein
LNYGETKKQILLEFKLTPKIYKDKFYDTSKVNGETWLQFGSRLELYLQYYLESRNVTTFETLQQLLISDRIREAMPVEVRKLILLREEEEWLKPRQMAEQADVYAANLQDVAPRYENGDRRNNNFSNGGHQRGRFNNRGGRGSNRGNGNKEHYDSYEQGKNYEEFGVKNVSTVHRPNNHGGYRGGRVNRISTEFGEQSSDGLSTLQKNMIDLSTTNISREEMNQETRPKILDSITGQEHRTFTIIAEKFESESKPMICLKINNAKVQAIVDSDVMLNVMLVLSC